MTCSSSRPAIAAASSAAVGTNCIRWNQPAAAAAVSATPFGACCFM